MDLQHMIQWGQQHRWLLLLIFLVAMVLFASLEMNSPLARHLGVVGFAILFLGVVGAIEPTLTVRWLMTGFVIVWFGLILMNQWAQLPSVDKLVSIMSGLLLLGTLVIGFRQLYLPAMSEYERLSSSVFNYIVMVAVWGLIYWRIEVSAPGSFKLPSTEIPPDTSTFLYFSMVTMTSLGYGDITPVSSTARTLAGLQAISGVLFIAIFIGRSVGRLR